MGSPVVTGQKKSLAFAALKAQQARISALIDVMVEGLLEEQDEFLPKQLIDEWIETDGEPWSDRKKASATVLTRLKSLEAQGILQSRFRAQPGAPGTGRRYYAWGPKGGPEALAS